MIGLCDDDFERDAEVLPPALRRPGLVLLDVRDGAEAVDVRLREQRRNASTTRNSAIAAPPDFRRTSTTRNMKSVAVSVRKPARENVTMTPPMLSSATAVANRRGSAARAERQRARNRDDQVQHQRQIVGIAGEARAPHVADDANQPILSRLHDVAGEVVPDAGAGERDGAEHERPRDARAVAPAS